MTGMNFAPRSGGGGGGPTTGYTSGADAYFTNIGGSASGQIISYTGLKIAGTPPVSTSGFATLVDLSGHVTELEISGHITIADVSGYYKQGDTISGANWSNTVSGAPFATRDEVSGALANYAPKSDVSSALQSISGAAWAANFSGQANYYKPGSTISGANWAASVSGTYQVSGVYATTPISGADWSKTVSGAAGYYKQGDSISGANWASTISGQVGYATATGVSSALQSISGAAWAAGFSGQANYYKPGSTISGASWAASFSGAYQVSSVYVTTPVSGADWSKTVSGAAGYVVVPISGASWSATVSGATGYQISGSYYTSGSNVNFISIVAASGTTIQGKTLVIGAPLSGQTITFDGTNYTPQTPPGAGSGYTSGAQAYFINIGGATSGQYIRYDGSKIAGSDVSAGGYASGDAAFFSDIGNAASGQVIQYDGTKIAGATIFPISGANWAASFSGIYQVSGVYVTAPVSGANFAITFSGQANYYKPGSTISGANWAASVSGTYQVSGVYATAPISGANWAVTVSGSGGYTISSAHTSSTIKEYNMRLTTTYSNALGSAPVTKLGFPIGANEAYIVVANITARNMSAGIRYIVSAPTGAIVEGWITTQSGVNTAQYSVRMSSINISYGPFHAVSGIQVNDYMTYTILNTGTAGSSCIIMVPNTFSGQRVEIIAGSYMRVEPALGV